MSVTESIVFAAEKSHNNFHNSRSKPLSLRDQIVKKQKLLWN